MHKGIILAAALAAAPAVAQQGASNSDPAPNGRMGPGGRMGGPAGMIRRADTNGDGVITRAEYIAAVDARFARMDRNGDGVLTPDEMPRRGGYGRGPGGVPGPNGGYVPSGYADAGEAAPNGQNPPPPPPNGTSPGATGMPPATPAGGPGAPGGPGSPDGPAMTRDQYRAMAMRRFDRWDANHDGRIDQAELAAIGQGGPGRRGGGAPDGQ